VFRQIRQGSMATPPVVLGIFGVKAVKQEGRRGLEEKVCKSDKFRRISSRLIAKSLNKNVSADSHKHRNK
jgi:hypothetical protein